MEGIEPFQEFKQDEFHKQPCQTNKQGQADDDSYDLGGAVEFKEASGQYEEYDDGYQILDKQEADDQFSGMTVVEDCCWQKFDADDRAGKHHSDPYDERFNDAVSKQSGDG